MPVDPQTQADKKIVANGPQFPATMWSMIQSAKTEEDGLVGLERLARAYWEPLYVVARQRGSTHEAAADEVQGFFEYLLSHEVLKNVQKGEVLFRSFLLRCFTNWVVNEYNRSQAAKRGGGATLLSVDEMVMQPHEPAMVEGRTPEWAYDHSWARALVDQALQQLDEEIIRKDRAVFLQELRRRAFATDERGPDWEEVARRHGLSHGAVRKAVSDLRRRFGVLLRREVRKVVTKDEEVNDELRHLVNLLSIDA
jgi:RNA polymerase sigma-70 factor (ECF subfamily)